VVAASCWSRRRTVTCSSATAAGVAAAAAAAGTKLTIARPDDWHLHVRDGATLSAVVPHTARVFGRAIIMPNLVPPVRTLSEAVRPKTTQQSIPACM
jgi:dihydroorotase